MIFSYLHNRNAPALASYLDLGVRLWDHSVCPMPPQFFGLLYAARLAATYQARKDKPCVACGRWHPNKPCRLVEREPTPKELERRADQYLHARKFR